MSDIEKSEGTTTENGMIETKKMTCSFTEVKFSNEAADGEMTFSGYGAFFNNVDASGDIIVPGAFSKTIKEAKRTGTWPSMLSQHGGWGISSTDNTPIGIRTLMEEDEKGLRVEGKFANTPRGIEAYTLLKMSPRPAFNGLSIGYQVVTHTCGNPPKDKFYRKLEEIKLYEISLVTFPCNDKARVSQVKSLEKRSIEQLLRDAGMSNSQAKKFISGGYELAFGDRDGDSDEGAPEAKAEVVVDDEGMKQALSLLELAKLQLDIKNMNEKLKQ